MHKYIRMHSKTRWCYMLYVRAQHEQIVFTSLNIKKISI